MGKRLIITEKPSVAQEFAKVLDVSGRKDGYIENSDYVITWCVGHLVSLVYPESYDIKYKEWRLEDLPFLPEQYKYDVIGSVRKQYEIVHHALHREDIDTVYWAGDAGKEGQTIEENIRNFGGVREGMEEKRVWIDSQTEEEILRGINEAKSMSDYANLGKSGIMRTIEDYAVGINFSRVMSVKYGRMLNNAAGTKSYTAIAVGRVMTCVLGMVVIREREIRNFVETPFYRVLGSFSEAEIEGEWKALEGSKYYQSPLLYKENGFKEEKDAKKLIEELSGRQGTIKTVKKSNTSKKPPLLFNLAELQAECSKRYKISPDETLQIAQTLYEKKLTTYPRTDARVLSTAVAKVINKNISGLQGYDKVSTFVEHILSDKLYSGIAKSQYTNDSKVTDHYAIIPTGQLTELRSLSSLQKNVYELIVRRFLAIFYPNAVYQNIKLEIQIDSELFTANAKRNVEPGYLEVLQTLSDNKENAASTKLFDVIDTLKKGNSIDVNSLYIKQGKTSPPKRYTSGSMILAMENAGQLIEDEELREQIKGSGIGTSATRAEIIKKLVRIEYLNLNKKTQILTPNTIGEMIFEIVNLTVPALLSPKMTANWEKGLDGITQGTVQYEEYREKLENFVRKETISMINTDLTSSIAERILPFAGNNASKIRYRKKLGVKCPECGGELETTPFGYGCSNYNKDGSGCRFAIGKIAGRALSEDEVTKLITEGRTDVLKGFISKKKKNFSAALTLTKSEDQKVSINFDFTDVKPEVIEDVVCPMCGSPVEITPFGYACQKYESKNPESCRFAIGKLAGKALTVNNIKELLTNGITSTIRGFTSKDKKKFDACIKLDKDDNGAVSLKFDFDNVEAKKLKDCKCPLCGGDITITPFGYGCSNYDRNNPESCRFAIGQIAGLKLKNAQVKELLNKGKLDTIDGFTSKTGNKFSAALKLDKGHVLFDFDNNNTSANNTSEADNAITASDENK